MLPLKTPERKAEAASAADATGAANEGNRVGAVTPGAKGCFEGNVPITGPEDAEDAEEFAGICGVSAREREVESTRPHGAEEGRTEAEEVAPERMPEEGKDEELIIETIKRGCAD